MADKTTGELKAVKVGELPAAPDIYDDFKMPGELQGEALHITGAQFKKYATAAGVEASEIFAKSVEASAGAAVAASEAAKRESSKAATYRTAAEVAAKRAEAARDSIEIDKDRLDRAVSSASASANAAKVSEGNAAASRKAAENAASRAQAEAERVSVPAAVGVYNVILTDRVTAERYALLVENGALAILGVSKDLEATEMKLIDSANGTAYELLVESGRLILEEV